MSTYGKGPHSVTNKGGSQLPTSNPRHSNLRNQHGALGKGNYGDLTGIGTNSNKLHKKRDNSLGGNENASQKYVKPSELSLDLIMPSSIRGASKPS